MSIAVWSSRSTPSILVSSRRIFREQFTLERDRLGPERIDLGREASIQPVDLHCEAGVGPVDLLIQPTDVAADRVELRGDEILERLLDLVVDTHVRIEPDPTDPVNVPIRNTPALDIH